MRDGETLVTPLEGVEEEVRPARKPFLCLEALSKDFGQRPVVDRLELGFHEGEFFSLLGPSGCGKTTTLRMIGGFERPTAGVIRLDGSDISRLEPHRRPVNTVFQSYALFSHLSVADNVAFGLRESRVERVERARRVREALELVRLEGLEKRRPRELSGGQQQRVAVARALVNRPRVLLLDEPLGALDLKLRKGLQIELKGLQAELGITFIYVTHDQEEALTMSDRIAVMRDGRIDQVGAPEEIYTRPATEYVADFIGAANRVPGVLRTIEGEIGRAETVDGRQLVGVPGNCAVGAECAVIIRPERCRFSPADSRHCLPGRVKQVLYLGHYRSVIVEVKHGAPFAVHVPDSEQRPALGDDVFVEWEPRDAWIIEKDNRG